VTSALPDEDPEECDCHEWFDLDEIGRWPHSLAGGRASQPKSVRDIVATEAIWDRSELPREELTARIIAAGHRIGYTHALSAMTFTDGRISLDNGVHRWSVAAELEISRLPVKMTYQSPEPAWAWSWW
jgi:hypothetical protein